MFLLFYITGREKNTPLPTRNNLNSAGEGPNQTCWNMKHLTDHKTHVTADNNTKESSLPLKRQILNTAITGSIVLAL